MEKTEEAEQPEGKLYLEVVCFATAGVVKKIDVTGKSEHIIEKTEMGLLRNMDTNRFYVSRNYEP